MYTLQSDKLGISYSFKESEWHSWLAKEDIRTVNRHKFEFISIPLPANEDAYLTRCFGDYHKFPDETERGNWHDGMIAFNVDKSYVEVLGRIEV